MNYPRLPALLNFKTPSGPNWSQFEESVKQIETGGGGFSEILRRADFVSRLWMASAKNITWG